VVDANHSITQIEETHPSNPIEDPSISGKGAETGAGNASIGSQTGSDLAGKGSSEVVSNNTKAIDFVDELPEYEGGDLALRQYLQNNLHFPRMAIDLGISGIVYVQFLVDKNGNIKDISVLKDIQGIFGTEAINAIKGMKKWKPAKYHGQNVGYFVKMPINFQIK
jgi:protein TonB